MHVPETRDELGVGLELVVRDASGTALRAVPPRKSVVLRITAPTMRTSGAAMSRPAVTHFASWAPTSAPRDAPTMITGKSR